MFKKSDAQAERIKELEYLLGQALAECNSLKRANAILAAENVENNRRWESQEFMIPEVGCQWAGVNDSYEFTETPGVYKAEKKRAYAEPSATDHGERGRANLGSST